MPLLRSCREKHRVILLPKYVHDPGFEIFVTKYRELRLLAIKTSSQFWSDYEVERGFTYQQWITKMTRQDVMLFVCVKMPDSIASELPLDARPLIPSDPIIQAADKERGNYERQLLLSQEYAGTLNIVGPISSEEYEMFMGREEEVEKQDMDTRWQIGNLFVHPSHRGQGITLMLGGAAYGYARSLTLQLLRNPASKLSHSLLQSIASNKGDEESPQQEKAKQDQPAMMRVRCLVKQTPMSRKLIEMYKSYWGFKELERRWTLKEVFVAESNSGLVPAGWEETSRWNTRDLTVLESVVIVGESDARQRAQGEQLIGEVIVGKDDRIRSRL